MAAADRHPGELEVGFNRRYNPLVERARKELAAESGPTTLVATIREVDITPDHWYLWPNQGTRVAGNLCHWIDLALHLIGPGRRRPTPGHPEPADDHPDGDPGHQSHDQPGHRATRPSEEDPAAKRGSPSPSSTSQLRFSRWSAPRR